MTTKVESVKTALASHIADGAVLYQRLRNYHWNVRGREFFRLHQVFEHLYQDWEEIVDRLAERAVSLGQRPPSTLGELLAGTQLQEEEDKVPNDREMVRRVIADLTTVLDALKATSADAESEGDFGTTNMLQDVVEKQEKRRWMLESFLADGR